MSIMSMIIWNFHAKQELFFRLTTSGWVGHWAFGSDTWWLSCWFKIWIYICISVSHRAPVPYIRTYVEEDVVATTGKRNILKKLPNGTWCHGLLFERWRNNPYNYDYLHKWPGNWSGNLTLVVGSFIACWGWLRIEGGDFVSIKTTFPERYSYLLGHLFIIG